MTDLAFKVKKYLIRQKMIHQGETLAAAVSAGPDSVAMFFCLNKLKKDMGFNLAIFHINHMLRGEESDRDETFVKNMANSVGIPFYSTRVDVIQYKKKHKCSVQVAARELRYFHFNKLAVQHSISKVATGHTANDQAETVLMRMLKGAGLRGISGIPPMRENKYIRPLLEVTREEIERFLNQKKINFLTDSTNLKNNYLRNRIKNKLLPTLKKEFNPSIVRTLCRSSQTFRIEDSYISEMAQIEFNKIVLQKNPETLVLDASRFQTLHIALKKRIILDAIYEFSHSKKQVSLNIVENILRVIASNISGKSISVFNDLIFKYQYNKIIFQSPEKIATGKPIKRRGAATKRACPELVEGSYRSSEQTKKTCLKNKFLQSNSIKQKKIMVPGKTKIKEIGKEIISTVMNKADIPKNFRDKGPFTAFIDYDFSKKEIFVRSREKGDRVSPLGIKGNKKLKDYFIDKKIPREERDSILLLTNKDSILWVVGHQISELARIKDDTKEVLMVELC